jgi:hypothetical protein
MMVMLVLGAEFAGNVVLVAVLFLILCGAAIVLEKFANLVKQKSLLPDFMVSWIKRLANGLFVVDVVLFVCLVGYHTVVFLGELFHHLVEWWTTLGDLPST